MSQTQPSLPRRRNGKPQACEPCRKRKMACDHTLPVCRRCVQRKTTASCVYLPAPMTNKTPKQTKSAGVEVEAQPISLSIPVLNVALTGLERTHSVDTPESQSTNGGSISQGSHVHSSPIHSHSAGFLGPTSFSAVFLENQRNIEHALPNATGQPGEQVVDQLQYQTRSDSSIDARHVQLGIKALAQLPDRETSLALLKLSLNWFPDYVWMTLATRHCIERLWATYKIELTKSRGGLGFEFLAHVLCKNSKIQLEEPDDGAAFLDSFSGHQMRWESLGIIFAVCAQGILSAQENDAIFTQSNGPKKNRTQFLDEMREGVSLCVSLCSSTDTINTLMAVLLFHNCILQSMLGVGGDTSFLLWRHHGDLIAVCTALGLHRDPDPEDGLVSIRIEVRRRIHACIFNVDKSLASFTGRPPFLSRRYTCCKMPLDISDEDLLLPQDQLALIATRLDNNGWNTRGQLNPMTYGRFSFQLNLIRDEILEIFLGYGQSPAGLAGIRDLKDRSEEVYANLPPIITYYPSDESNPSIDDNILWVKISGRLRHLQNHFLLERMAIKHGQKNGQELLDVSKETMALILLIWTQRDRFIGRHYSYDWMILSFGVPASGVLCVELLKHSKLLQEANIPPSSQPRLPLSETVQTLSLFTAFLGWVKPSVANYEICNRIRGIISRLLDQTLDGPSADLGTVGMGKDSVAAWVGDGDFDGVWAADFLDFDFTTGANGGEDWGMWDSTEWTAPWVGLA